MSAEPPFKTGTAVVVRKRILLAGGLLLLVVGTLVFPFPMKGRLWGDIFDLAHAPVFCLSLIALVGFLDPPAAGFPSRFQTIIPMTIRRVALITFVLMCAGLIGEYLQKFADRNPSWGDVLANSAGLLAGLCWIASCTKKKPVKSVLALATMGIIVAISMNPLLEVWDSIQRMRSFPMLASFERPREIGNWVGHQAVAKISDEWSSDGNHSLHVSLSKSEYPGTAMLYLEPDWTAYKQLHLDIKNPSSKTLRLILKLQDQQHSNTGFDYHDRYHQEITIQAGEVKPIVVDLSVVRNAPSSRQMNMSQINMIDIFSVDVDTPVSFYIDHVRLSR